MQKPKHLVYLVTAVEHIALILLIVVILLTAIKPGRSCRTGGGRVAGTGKGPNEQVRCRPRRSAPRRLRPNTNRTSTRSRSAATAVETPQVGQEVTWGLAPHTDGVYAVGYIELIANGMVLDDAEGFIRKYDTAGHLLWSKTFGVENDEYGAAVASDAEGNAYVAGLTGSNVQPSAANDVFLRKFSPEGQKLWQQRFGSADRDEVSGIAVSGDALYVVGSTQGELADKVGGTDAFITKYTTSGDALWTRQFGSTGTDFAYDVAVDDEGYAYVTGQAHGSLTGAKPNGTFLRRYSPDGNAAWTRQMPYGESQTFSKVAVRGENVYLGFSYDPARYFVGANKDIRLLRFNRDGAQDTSWAFDYANPTDDDIWDLSTDELSNVYFAGRSALENTSSDGLIVKLDSRGALVWEHRAAFTASSVVLAVLPRTQDEVYGAGNAYKKDTSSSRAFLQRLSGSNGGTLWSATE